MGIIPAPHEFPDVIKPVTASNFENLHRIFAVDEGRRNSAEIQYERLTARIAERTGHERAHDRDGRPYTSNEWQKEFFKSWEILNEKLALGFDKDMLDIMTLCSTVLKDTPRYGGDPLISPEKGENTGVHSLHTLLQAYRIYQKALESEPDLKNDMDFFRSFQMTCVLLAVHDLGEMFGEPGSVAQADHAKSFAAKDKYEFEKMTFNYAVKLAVKTVIDKNPEDEFFARIYHVKGLLDVQNKGMEKSDAQLAEELESALEEGDVTLSPRAEKVFRFLRKAWEWVESPDNSAHPMLGRLATVCERVQGTRHINRHHREDAHSVFINDDGQYEKLRTFELSPGRRNMMNTLYCEGALGQMCDAADRNSEWQMAVAKQAAAWVYETTADFFASGTKAFFVDSSVNELPLHPDGTAYTPSEVQRRFNEIALAEKVAEIEFEAVVKDSGGVKEPFQAAAMPYGRTAVTRDQVVTMYERAIKVGYLPTVVTPEGGKSRSEILLVDRPAALIGDVVTNGPASKRAAAKVDKLVNPLRQP